MVRLTIEVSEDFISERENLKSEDLVNLKPMDALFALVNRVAFAELRKKIEASDGKDVVFNIDENAPQDEKEFYENVVKGFAKLCFIQKKRKLTEP